jgi:hypothetical protein
MTIPCEKADDIGQIKADVRWIRENLEQGAERFTRIEERLACLETTSAQATGSWRTGAWMLGILITVVTALIKAPAILERIIFHK